MKKVSLQCPDKFVMGFTIRANNTDKIVNIGALVGRYFSQNLAVQIPGRKHPGVTLSAYTQYDSDEHGDYTYFIGEEVSQLVSVPGLDGFVIPAGNYVKFTTDAGEMPMVVIEAWQKIWQMSAADFGGARSYIFDYEVHDQRAMDPKLAVLDIYLGLRA